MRRVWRYQRGNQNPYIKEEQTTQWSKEKRQKDKQRSTKHTNKTKNRVTRTSLKSGVWWNWKLVQYNTQRFCQQTVVHRQHNSQLCDYFVDIKSTIYDI